VKYFEKQARFNLIVELPTKQTKMKNAIIFFFVLAFLPNTYAQTQDSIITKFESNYLKITHNLTQSTFQINHKKGNLSFENLKYVGSVGDSYQVIDADNEIFLLDATSLEKKEEAKSMYWLCGTVPHYTLAVEETKNDFVVTRDETFYDFGNQVPAEEFVKISKDKADEILFINGKNTFDFSSNFSYSTKIINPETIILVKDGKYTVLGQEELQYDSIDFTAYSPTLKYSTNNLVGYLNITEAKYKTVSDFQNNLAKVTTVEGKEIIIDMEGNEYF